MQSRLETGGQRLIDAYALMRKIDDLVPMGKKSEGLLRELRCVLVRLVTKTPTVDAVEVVHGRWGEKILAGGLGEEWGYVCSECRCTVSEKSRLGKYQGRNQQLNYCPNCGAKMDGERGEGE